MYTLQIAFQSLFRLNPNKNRLVDCFYNNLDITHNATRNSRIYNQDAL